jgi:hypothetical protein
VIRAVIDILPGGDPRRARSVAVVEIENDCSGDEITGNYRATIRGSIHADVTVRDWDRSRGEAALVGEVLRRATASG